MDLPALEMVDVCLEYRRGAEVVRALDLVNLRVQKGEVVSIRGPSGSGKSSLLGIAAGLMNPLTGEVRTAGTRLATATRSELNCLRRRDIGMVFQSFHLIPVLTVRDNIALPLALDGRTDHQRVDELVGRLGLTTRAHHYPSALSGGERQRVAVARALAASPQLVLADEPTGSLDSQSGRGVLNLLIEQADAASAAVILVTHDAEAARLGHRELHLRDGRLELAQDRT